MDFVGIDKPFPQRLSTPEDIRDSLLTIQQAGVYD